RVCMSRNSVDSSRLSTAAAICSGRSWPPKFALLVVFFFGEIDIGTWLAITSRLLRLWRYYAPSFPRGTRKVKEAQVVFGGIFDGAIGPNTTKGRCCRTISGHYGRG